MTLFMPVQRATLILPTDGSNHLFILLTNPKQPDGYACNHNLLVPIGSIYPNKPHDSTCRLYTGDHVFITHDSYVNYKFVRIEETQKLNDGCKNGYFKQLDNLDTRIFARVCQGLMDSRHTPLKAKIFYET